MKTVFGDEHMVQVVGSVSGFRQRLRRSQRTSSEERDGSLTPREEYQPHVSRQVHASMSSVLGRGRAPTMSEAFAS